MSRLQRLTALLVTIIVTAATTAAHATVTATQAGTALTITLSANFETATISHSAGNVVVVNQASTTVFTGPAAGIQSLAISGLNLGQQTVTFADGFSAPGGITISNIWYENYAGSFDVDTGGINATSVFTMELDNAQVTSSTGAITFMANSGGGTSAGAAVDGLLINQSSITSTSGNIRLGGIGIGGSGTKNGVHIASSQVTTAGAGTILVTGTGNEISADAGNSNGILVDGATSVVSTVNGSLQLSGVADDGAANSNIGLAIHDGAQVFSTGSTGTAAVTLFGAGGGRGASTGNYGIDISGAPAATVVSAQTNNALLILQAIPGVGASSNAISIGSTGFGTIKTAATINLVADSIDLASGASVNAGTHGVQIATRTASASIDVGGADATGTLGISNAELSRITAGTLIIGSASETGLFTVSAPISFGSPLQLGTSGSLAGPGAVTAPKLTLFDSAANTVGSSWVVDSGTVTKNSATPLNFITPALAITGGGGNDTFTVTPFAGTTISISGGNPTTPPGDALNIVPGAAIPLTLTSTPAGSGFSGTMTFSNAASVTFTGIETGSVALNVLNITLPATAQVGVPVDVTVSAIDPVGGLASSYTGIVHFTSSDPTVILPANTTLINGSGMFPVTFMQLGNPVTVTATDTVRASLTGTTSIAVGAGDATHFTVSAPAATVAGSPVTFTVTALDAFNNVATGYTDSVHFTSSDVAASLPADSTLVNGVGSFSATLVTAGTSSISAFDIGIGFTATSNAISVSSGAATHLSVSSPANATAGVAASVTVTAFDAFNNLATGYAGTVHFTSSDSQATLPANANLVGGTGSFIATLKTSGTETITATDAVTAAITGTSGAITVAAAAASHLTVSAPASLVAGTATNFTVTALDAFNNVATTYGGAVHFTSSDAQGLLPANSALASGTGTFSATLKTIGNQTIAATDTVSAITGMSAAINVAAAVTTRFTVTAPASATAGAASTFTVTAMDTYNNVATNYSGSVHFTSSDATATLPADATLASGVGTFNATLKIAGAQTITATDTASALVNGTSGGITVTAGAATRLAVVAPAGATSGTAISITVTAFDAFNNTATGFAGTVHVTSTDGASTLPANATLTNGVGTFSATLKTGGTQTITATDTLTSSITGTSGAISVSAAAATHFGLSAPAGATAATAFNFTITALDAFNNTATAYVGTVHVTSSDGAAVLPANSALTSGVGTFSATLKTGGTQTITATDTATSSITGTSGAISVTAATATHFAVSASATSTAGSPVSFTVTAIDAFNNTAAAYSGTVHFTTTDGRAVLPANATLTSGVGTFSATLKTSGTRTITATDTVTSAITGTSGAITVNAAAATHFSLSAPAGATATTAFNFTITALDAFNNTATAYAGTVHVTSSDGAAALPANSGLASGVGTFSATLKTTGSQTITAADTVTSSIAGTSSTIAVSAGMATHFSLSAPAIETGNTAFSVTVTALDQFNNTATGYAGTIHFTSSDAQAILPADLTLAAGVGTFTATLRTAGNRTITATDTVSAAITGTSAINVVMNSYSATSATGTGTITATFTGGGASCSFSSPQFIGAPPGAPPIPPTRPSSTITFPQGMFDFSLVGCTPGSTITMTITYPASIAGMQYWKYGPEASNAAAHWYVMPSTISGNTVTFSITDGGQGDDDLSANGEIDDQGGPGAGVSVAVPTMSWWMLVLMALMLAVLGRKHRLGTDL